VPGVWNHCCCCLRNENHAYCESNVMWAYISEKGN